MVIFGRSRYVGHVKYTLTVKISPSAPFGVPQDGYTVAPAEAGVELFSDALDSVLGKVVGHGSLSRYRSDSDAIRETLTVGEFELTIADNFGFISVEAESYQDALEGIKAFVERFLVQLAVRQRRSFDYEILGLVDSNRQRYPATPTLFTTRATMYNLQELREAIREAVATSSATDERLERASQYFEHAAFLFEKRQDLALPGSRHFTALISAIFLSLAKAVTVIVGDPSSDRDHQRRYKEIGLDYDFYKERIGRVLELRNNYDVAHHDLTGRAVEAIEQHYGEAVETASVILARYSEHLNAKE